MASGKKPDEIVVVAARDRFFSTPFRSYVYGKIFYAIPMERNIARSTLEQVEADLEQARCELEQNKVVVVFPEGTRSDDGSIQKFSNCASKLAKKAHCPIVPAYIHGAYEAWSRHRWFQASKLEVRFGAELSHNTSGKKLKHQVEALRQLSKRAAFFDVDGTLTQTKVTDYHVWRVTKNCSPSQRVAHYAVMAPQAAFYFLLNLINRGLF